MGVQLKYCGNHSLGDFQVISASKADYIGFVFAESKRKADPKEIRKWLETVSLPPNKKLVGVFVNPTIEEVSNVMNEVPLDIIQCHGDEPPTMVVTLKNIFSVPVWKVIHHSESALEKMDEYKGLADAYLIDHKTSSAWGGTGESFDWSFVPSYLEKARDHRAPCLIAGGVNPNNISALLQYQPDGIDLASGIEKNNQKNQSLIQLLEERVEQDEYHRT